MVTLLTGHDLVGVILEHFPEANGVANQLPPGRLDRGPVAGLLAPDLDLDLPREPDDLFEIDLAISELLRQVAEADLLVEESAVDREALDGVVDRVPVVAVLRAAVVDVPGVAEWVGRGAGGAHQGHEDDEEEVAGVQVVEQVLHISIRSLF